MKYHIGDQVVHWQYGLGKITSLDEKSLAGQTRLYYVVEIDQLTIWVPVVETGQSCLRVPTKSSEFRTLIRILDSPGDQLVENQFERQKELAQRMQRRTLTDVCHVICDLNSLSRVQKLNRNDSATLNRAKEFLLVEWEHSLGTTHANAQRELDTLLRDNPKISPAVALP
jgi:RNA polymerase-interacting CarD/CdnL/TRCF family regulator